METVVKILVVEDEWLIGESLKASLEALGHQVLGPAMSCAAALDMIRAERPDIAFVDTQLGPETCELVLDECRRQATPVVITSGHTGNDLPEFCSGLTALGKPYSDEEIAGTLRGHGLEYREPA